MKTLFTLTMAALAVGVLASRPARGCEGIGPIAHVLDPEAQVADHVAPTLTTTTLVRIQRGRDTGGSCSGGPCDGNGTITIAVAAADDATPAEQLGYRMTAVTGAPPHGFTLPETAIRPFGGTPGQLELEWHDGDSDDQEGFSFTLEVVAIDLAGNESAPQTLMIADGSGGCRVAGRAPPLAPGTFAGLLMALAALTRRRPRGAHGGAPRA